MLKTMQNSFGKNNVFVKKNNTRFMERICTAHFSFAPKEKSVPLCRRTVFAETHCLVSKVQHQRLRNFSIKETWSNRLIDEWCMSVKCGEN